MERLSSRVSFSLETAGVSLGLPWWPRRANEGHCDAVRVRREWEGVACYEGRLVSFVGIRSSLTSYSSPRVLAVAHSLHRRRFNSPSSSCHYSIRTAYGHDCAAGLDRRASSRRQVPLAHELAEAVALPLRLTLFLRWANDVDERYSCAAAVMRASWSSGMRGRGQPSCWRRDCWKSWAT